MLYVLYGRALFGSSFFRLFCLVCGVFASHGAVPVDLPWSDGKGLYVHGEAVRTAVRLVSLLTTYNVWAGRSRHKLQLLPVWAEKHPGCLPGTPSHACKNECVTTSEFKEGSACSSTGARSRRPRGGCLAHQPHGLQTHHAQPINHAQRVLQERVAEVSHG